MSKNENKDLDILLSLQDFFLICSRAKKKVYFWAASMALLMVLYTLTNPIEYLAHATFREKGKAQSGIAYGSLSSMLLTGSGGGGNNSEAISTMKSRTLLEELITKLNLQGRLIKKETSFPTLHTLSDNLITEYALWTRKQGPVFPYLPPIISLKDVAYAGDTPIGMRLKFTSEDTFKISYPKTKDLHGKIGEAIHLDRATFTVVRNSDHQLITQEYDLVFEPMLSVVKRLTAKINIETDRDDKSLLALSFSCSDPAMASTTLNELMNLYQEYLKQEQQRMFGEQIDYLQKRHDEMKSKLYTMMQEHASSLSSEVVTSGFPNTTQAMEFLGSTQQQYAKSLLSIDLELKRLRQARLEGVDHYERYASGDNGSTINQIVAQIRQLKHQGDSLELALRETTIIDDKHLIKEMENVAIQFAKLQSTKHLRNDAKLMLDSLEAGKIPDTSLELYQEPRYMVKTWCDKLVEKQGRPQEFENCVANFKSYLANLIHLFHVQEKSIQERLTHQQSTQVEFQGINLNTAQEIYIGYSKELDNVEAEIAQKRFIIDQIQEPTFEISSLSAVLTDSVSTQMIHVASQLLLNLQDQNNRSLKEQERLRHDLGIQKGFLAMHLNQTIQLLQLREKLLREKIQALQSNMLGLIQQEVSVLQRHLVDHTDTRINALLQERDVIGQHQHELQQEMAKLPKKWVAEKLIDQQMVMNERMVEEITKLVESKNTTSNLELIQSAPLDEAFTVLQPKSPRVVLFALIGAILGTFFVLSFEVVKTLLVGIPITQENLKLGGFHVNGSLKNLSNQHGKPFSDHDLDTLRKVLTFCEGSKDLLLVTHNKYDYAKDLAVLASKKDRKVLLIPLSFDEVTSKDEQPGLLEYLEGKVDFPKINSHDGYDFIATGGISRFSSELMGTSAFQKMMHKLYQKYDLIIGVSHAVPNSSEAIYLTRLFAKVVLSIKDETWENLDQVIKGKDKELIFEKISFVMHE